jgi:hypothetical protein
VTEFDYSTGAELFPSKARKSKLHSLRYRRFKSAADAIRFAIEELPPVLLVGAYLQVDEERFDHEGIRRLYESADYPLKRRAAVEAIDRPQGLRIVGKPKRTILK